MSCQNDIPEYVPKDLPWYKRDCLMTYIDQVKCRDFLRDLEDHFKNTKIINFDVIHCQMRGEKAPEDLFKKYQTVQENRTKNYFQRATKEFLSLCV